MDKQSGQAVLTTEKGFRKGPFVLYAGVLVMAVSLMFTQTVAAEADSPTVETTIVDETTEGLSEAESVVKEPAALQKVKNAMSRWVEGPIGKELEKRGYQFFTGIYEVPIRTSRRQWIKARSAAYSGAFVDALANYASFMGTEVLSDIESNFYEDDIQRGHVEYQENQALTSFAGRMFAKGMALTEHQLTQKLAEIGMSDDEIQRLEPVQRVPTLINAYISGVIAGALEKTAGLVPVATFEEIDREGKSAIGVVTLVDERMLSIAEKILSGEPISPDASKIGKPIRERIASYEDTELTKEFGIRVWWDEHGYPTIVSFGQAGSSSSSRAASIKAKNNARQHIANFINSSTNVLDETKTKNIVEKGYKVSRDGEKETYDNEIMRDIVNQTINVKAEVEISGVKPIKSWSAPHPIAEDHEIVGEVLWWSPKTEDIARVIAGKEEKRATIVNPPQERPNEPDSSGSLKNREPDLNDF